MGQVASVIARSRAARAVTVIALASSAIVGVAAAPAAATIGTCSGTVTETDNTVYCTGSRPSAFQAYVHCTGTGGYHTGAWEFAGDGISSRAACPRNTFVIVSESGVNIH